MTLPLTGADPVRLGDYEILARLGTGGQGVVYLGRPLSGTGQVAIKLLHARMVADAGARARFVRELALLQRVAGFCTAQMLEADMAGDQPYIVSEYVPGPSLRELVHDKGPRLGADLDRLAISSVTALTAIHRAGIVHRDFKPQNVLMGPDGPRVIDFGIARALDSGATVTSQIVGTPAYMAPEQLAGAEIAPAADMFAWAATLLFAATGRDPFAGGPLPAVMYRIMHHTPDTSVLPAQIGEIADACLQKDPTARPSAESVLLWLLGERSGSHGVTPVVPPSPSVNTPEYTEVDPRTGVPRQGRRGAREDGRDTGTAPAPGPPGQDRERTPPSVPTQRRDHPDSRDTERSTTRNAAADRDAPARERDRRPPDAERPTAPYPPKWDETARQSAAESPPEAGQPYGGQPYEWGEEGRYGPGGAPPAAPPPEGAYPDAAGQGFGGQGGPGAGPATRPSKRRAKKAARAQAREQARDQTRAQARGQDVPARRLRRLPRSVPVITGLLLAALLAVIDVAALALFVAQPELTQGPKGEWLLVLSASFVLLAIITLVGVVMAFLGSRAAAWTVLLVRVLRVPLWGALSALTLVVVRPADLAIYAAVTALVVVLLTMGLRSR
ncbi:protein kinase domain-containing protein [Spirillospora sp. CA-255316]